MGSRLKWETRNRMEAGRASAKRSREDLEALRRHEDAALEAVRVSPCWCGQPFPHDWPGKNEGAPHPR